eukprot:6466128-Amphidinium_carterae.1
MLSCRGQKALGRLGCKGFQVRFGHGGWTYGLAFCLDDSGASQGCLGSSTVDDCLRPHPRLSFSAHDNAGGNLHVHFSAHVSE